MAETLTHGARIGTMDPMAPVASRGLLQGGKDHDGGFGFCLCQPLDGQAAHAGNGRTLAFAAHSAAPVRDPDGDKPAFVHHHSDPATEHP